MTMYYVGQTDMDLKAKTFHNFKMFIWLNFYGLETCMLNKIKFDK